ncbi:opsin-3 [Platysternon megacephalum]|uniref:Opsin-3 n=1 Tax=Platysternon megacephalum TaxID=55544 RepID=A0A4D9ECQ4_9SAUR|nr:opsin-3 [Platysternon megacephalum]
MGFLLCNSAVVQTGSQIDSCNVVEKETLDLVVATSLPAGRIFNRAACSILYKEGFMYNSLMTRVPNEGYISETFSLLKIMRQGIGYCQIFHYETLTISHICKGANQLLYPYRQTSANASIHNVMGLKKL